MKALDVKRRRKLLHRPKDWKWWQVVVRNICAWLWELLPPCALWSRDFMDDVLFIGPDDDTPQPPTEGKIPYIIALGVCRVGEILIPKGGGTLRAQGQAINDDTGEVRTFHLIIHEDPPKADKSNQTPKTEGEKA